MKKQQLTIIISLSVIFLIAISGYFFMNNENKSQMKKACITIGIPQIYDTYDPLNLTTTAHVYVVYALSGTLVTIGDNNEIFSGIASSWEISNNFRSFKFFISDQSRFSDGSKITAKDVSDSLKRFIIKGGGTHIDVGDMIEEAKQLKNMDDKINGIEINDNSTITIRLRESYPNFLRWIALLELGILPSQEAHKNKGELNFHVTSGAYFIDSLTPNKNILLKKNSYFYQKFGSAGDCIEIKGIPNVELAIKMLKNNQIDMLDYGAILDPEFEYFFKDNKFNITEGVDKALMYFVLNPKRPLLKEKSNRQWLFKNMTQISLIPYGNQSVFYETKQFLSSHHLGHLSDKEIDSIVDKMNDKQIEKKEITILYPEIFGDGYKKLINQSISAMLPWKVKFITYPEGKIEQALNKDDYDMFFIIVGTAEKDTAILMSYHFTRGNPLYRFEDIKLLNLVTEAKQSTDKVQKVNLYKKINRLLIEKAYIVPIASFTWPIFHRSDLYFNKVKKFSFSNDIWRISWK